MLTMTNAKIAATALVPLGLALPLTVGGARADCLSDVEMHRSMLDQGRLETLDLDRGNERGRGGAEPSGAPIAGSEEDKVTSADGSLKDGVSVEMKTGTVTVPVGKRKPRESWLGNPANAKAAEKHDGGDSPLEGEVAVQTDTSMVTVPVGEGKPRESWFGNPPSLKTVTDYLDGAEIAAKKGDEAACLEQLKDARAAVTARAD